MKGPTHSVHRTPASLSAPVCRALWCGALSLATLLGLPRALAQEERPPPKPFPVQIQGELYLANVHLGRLFDAALREKLGSGLTTRIVIRTQVLDLEGNTVRALGVSEYRILYRVWEEDYIVRHWSALGERSFKLRHYEDVMRRVSRQRSLPLATRADLPAGGRYQAVVEVEVDPVSEELLTRVREYLSNPGGHRAEGGGRGLFGNLARIFFDPRGGSGGAVLELRSELFGGVQPTATATPAPAPSPKQP